MLRAAGGSPPTVQPLPPAVLRDLYAWLDGLPLSRPKRHLARDFSDGVMLAEIVKHFHPQLVDLHNYTPTCNTDRKLSNWSTLNRKVFHKLHFCVSESEIRNVVANTPGAVEPILCTLRTKVEEGPLGRSPPSENPVYRRPLSSSSDTADQSWEPLDPRVQQLLEDKEQAIAILQETVKILQMKVARLEQLVQLKDLRIQELAGPEDKKVQ
ncbi:sperm flagellar protein 1-like [Rhynchocyon petersi]